MLKIGANGREQAKKLEPETKGRKRLINHKGEILMKKIIVAVLCLLVFSIPALATDLVNKDSKKYRVEINPDSYTRTEMDVAASSSYPDKLKKGYIVTNLTTGEKITVTTDRKVSIVDGKFKQE